MVHGCIKNTEVILSWKVTIDTKPFKRDRWDWLELIRFSYFNSPINQALIQYFFVNSSVNSSFIHIRWVINVSIGYALQPKPIFPVKGFDRNPVTVHPDRVDSFTTNTFFSSSHVTVGALRLFSPVVSGERWKESGDQAGIIRRQKSAPPNYTLNKLL